MKAKTVTKTEEVKVTKKVITGITLELSLEEAVALYILTGKVGGNPTGSIRLYTNGMYNLIGDLLNLDGMYNKEFVKADVNYEVAKDGCFAQDWIKEQVKKITG